MSDKKYRGRSLVTKKVGYRIVHVVWRVVNNTRFAPVSKFLLFFHLQLLSQIPLCLSSARMLMT